VEALRILGLRKCTLYIHLYLVLVMSLMNIQRLPLPVILLVICMQSSIQAQISFPKDTDLCQHEPWKLVFHDEFDGASLDKSKWITYNPTWSEAIADYMAVPPANDAAAAMHMIKVDDYRSFYSSDNVVVNDGMCQLIFRHQPVDTFGGSARFTTGKLFHKKPFHSGRFDIRCKVPRAGGVWAAFWLMGVRACDAPQFPGGGEIDCFEYAPCESDLKTISTTITGYKRFGCNGPQPSTSEHFRVDKIDEWHVFSTEWDRNFIRCFVDGQLKVEFSRYLNKKGPADCHPGRSIYNGQWQEQSGYFPYYDSVHNQNLMVELKSTLDLYSSNFLGICTPSLRSRDYIDEHMADRIWTIDYIRVYQRENNIQAGLADLCPSIKGRTIARSNSNMPYTYTITNYESIRHFKWVLGEGVKVIKDQGNSIDVIFTTEQNTNIGGRWDSAEEGCEERSYTLAIKTSAGS
jgi:beta-glucanase (GH16 family)